jgi:pyruvate-formate lyase-activating enzyme
MAALGACRLCPRECGVDRLAGERGFCGAGAVARVAAASIHHGEEPPISGTRGSGTVFFSHCNMACRFCQNYPISQLGNGRDMDADALAGELMRLQSRGAHNANFVTPTPHAAHIAEAVSLARRRGFTIPVVYNTNGFDSLEALELLDGVVDIYLPDAKYRSGEVAEELSGCSDAGLAATPHLPVGTLDLLDYWAPMLGLYPVRGCPYQCKYCSVIKIAGRHVRSPQIESTLESLRRARNAGIRMVMFVSDNFNKFPDIRQLLEEMIRQDLGLSFHCQCDTQIARDPALIELMGRAGCYEMFVGVESISRDTLKAVGKFHNDPARYEALVRMCREAGIRAHFSNIIGFPDQDESAVRSHVDALKQLSPTIVSFYILTPIPGTEQYHEYRSAGLINERNLDRFDATHATWDHPNLSGAELEKLLYQCYVDYCDFLRKKGGLLVNDRRDVEFIRYMAAHRVHPMSGGINRVVLDRAADYSDLRRNLYGIDLVPLPDNLRLSPQDEALNRRRNSAG